MSRSHPWGTAKNIELFLTSAPKKTQLGTMPYSLLCRVVLKFAEKVLIRVFFETLLVLLNGGTEGVILWQIQSNSHGRHLLLDGRTLVSEIWPWKLISVPSSTANTMNIWQLKIWKNTCDIPTSCPIQPWVHQRSVHPPAQHPVPGVRIPTWPSPSLSPSLCSVAWCHLHRGKWME